MMVRRTSNTLLSYAKRCSKTADAFYEIRRYQADLLSGSNVQGPEIIKKMIEICAREMNMFLTPQSGINTQPSIKSQ